MAQEVHRVAMEQTMGEYLDDIDTHAADTTNEGRKNLWAANIGLMAYLKNMCDVKPGIIYEEFQKVGDIDGNLQGINIVTSEDKKLRVYCWDTWTSKKVHRFNSLVQYRVGDAIERVTWADIAEKPGKMGNVQDCYSEINTVYDKDNRPIYLVMSFSINEGHEGAHEIQAFAIDSVLAPVAVFNFYGELKTTLKVSKDKAIRGNWSEDDTNIKISPDGRSIYVPVVRSANVKAPVSKDEKRYHVYQFNGREFVYKENLNN
ncbi:MAG: hypothetical protein JNL72_06750 [Flavipsychrobacter sp.]|nr:hypothetical protein [Flavipsychrobacter sp.]